MEYSVGQVLFIMMPKEMAVIPVQVSERIVRETLDGQATSYMLSVPGKERAVSLEKVPGVVYTSLSDVKTGMIENVTSVISSLVDRAEKIAQQSFNYSTESAMHDATVKYEKKDQELATDEANVTFPDGTVAKVSLPKDLQ